MLRESPRMPDHFAALAQPRRPWLDEDALKEAFHRASAAWHPDVAGSGDTVRFAAASAAYSALRDPVSRLRHLLELEAPEKLAAAQPIPPGLADLFMPMAEVRAALDAFRKKSAAATGALAGALLAEEKIVLRRRCEALLAELTAVHGDALDALRALDAAWEPRAADATERLVVLHQHFAYLGKWRAQLSEALFQLAN